MEKSCQDIFEYFEGLGRGIKGVNPALAVVENYRPAPKITDVKLEDRPLQKYRAEMAEYFRGLEDEIKRVNPCV